MSRGGVGDGADERVEQRHYTLTLRNDGIVHLTRTALQFEAVTELSHAYDAFLAVVDDWLLVRRIKLRLLGTKTRTPMGWLFDMRGAPAMRNDPEFERVIKERRADLLKRGTGVALLVKTAAGRMQLRRITSDSAGATGVFDDPAEAETWLLDRIAGR